MHDLVQRLSEIRLAVMAGEYSHLASILSGLTQATDALSVEVLDDLQALRAEAARTAACLEAAMLGIRSARRRVTEIAEVAGGLTTYDRDGTRATFANPAPSLRRV